MQDSDWAFTVSENYPKNREQWNGLAERCSNIWQTTFNDEVQLFFNNHPWYFECHYKNKIIGGLKIYFYESKKLPRIIRAISSRATQGSEFLFDAAFPEFFLKFKGQLILELKRWLLKKRATVFYEYSFYGETDKLIQLPEQKKIWESKIGIASIELSKTEEELWQQVHLMHRRKIVKAKKQNVTIEFANDIDSFFVLLDETYRDQKSNAPNKNFIRKEYETFRANNSAIIAFAKHDGKYLCGALLYNYGKKSLYNFGGSIRNNLGAGQFLHWEIIKHLKENNFQQYLMGEIALRKDESNLKFSEGITQFKLRFGGNEFPSFHSGFVFSQYKLFLWNWLKKILIK